jgi:chromate transport protein ChrA
VAVVEIDHFTDVKLTQRFAITFAVLTTMAIQALWVIAQYYSDAWFGTTFLLSQAELQWDFVIVTGVGILFGVLFGWYFERIQPVDSSDQRLTER